MKIINDVKFTEWEKMVRDCKYATFFQTPTWYKIISETFPKMKICSKKIILNDKTIIVPLLHEYEKNILSPFGVYGGYISSDNLSSEENIEISKWIKKNTSNIVWRANPFSKQVINNATINDFTQFIDLRTDFDKIYNNFSKGHRYNIKIAKKNSIQYHVASSEDDYKKYYEIYQDSIKRWGKNVSSKYKYTLFENIFKNQDKNIKLWLATYMGKVISGALVFYHNKHSVWWHGAGLEKYHKLYANNFLQYIIIKNAHGNNYHYYDFNPSGGHDGVIKFKKGFGSKKLTCNVLIKESRLIKLKNVIKKCLRR
jgi:lipid II:glycine glycyltransferase (peptidoglycan interpeptide bridge formation enzyme)